MSILTREIAVSCLVRPSVFGLPYHVIFRCYVLGTLVLAQEPYETNDGVMCEGWPAHLRDMQAYTECLRPLYLRTRAQEQAVERAALVTLRFEGELEDDDAEIIAQYG